MTSEEPDYTKCSLADLYDVAKRIDAEAYPERYAALQYEIQMRRERAEKWEIGSLVLDTPKQSNRVPILTISSFLVVSALLTLARVFDGGVSGHRISNVIAYAVPGFVYGTMALAGVLLSLRCRQALILGILVVGAQVPLLQIGHLSYAVTSVPTIEAKMWPLLGFSLTFSHRMTILWSESRQPLYVGINMTACGVLVPLMYYHERQKMARARLGRRREKVALG